MRIGSWGNTTFRYLRVEVLVGELKALRAGKVERVIYGKELELDGQILNFYRLEVEGHPWFLWPDSERFEHERYLRSIAAYRKEFPPVLPSSQVTGVDEVSKQMRDNNSAITATTNRIISAYGK